MSSGEDHVVGDERPGAEAEPLALELNLPVTNVRVNVACVFLAADDRVGPGITARAFLRAAATLRGQPGALSPRGPHPLALANCRTSLFKNSDAVVQRLPPRDVWMRSITGHCWIN
jgi:hypothetical protein